MHIKNLGRRKIPNKELGRIGSYWLVATVWDVEKVLDMDGRNGYITLNALNDNESHTLNC